MFEFLEFRRVGALFLAMLMLAVSCSQYEMKEELKVGVDNQETTEITVDNTYGESLKLEQEKAFNYFYNNDNVKICKLKTEGDITEVINDYAKHRGIENYQVCEANIEILSKYFSKEIDELGILDEMLKVGYIDKITYNLFVKFDNKIKTIENEKDYNEVINWFTNEVKQTNLSVFQKKNLLENISVLVNTADILDEIGEKSPCSDCMKKKKWYLIGIGGAALVLLTIACVEAPIAIPLCIALGNLVILWLICVRFCGSPCDSECAIFGW